MLLDVMVRGIIESSRYIAKLGRDSIKKLDRVFFFPRCLKFNSKDTRTNSI